MWHMWEEQLPAWLSQPFSGPSSLSPYPNTLPINFTNTRPLWAAFPWGLRGALNNDQCVVSHPLCINPAPRTATFNTYR